MLAKVKLNIVAGELEGNTFPFDARTLCIVGRALDCNLKLPDDQAHSTISRYHCLLDINPPEIRVRDFGSRNGTFVNGLKIGQREKGQSADSVDRGTFPEIDLHEGDKITLGNTVLEVKAETFCEQETERAPGLTETHGPSAVKLDGADPVAETEDLCIEGHTLLRELGRGGMGKVYLARNDETGEQVAVKTLLPQVAVDEYARSLFLREVKNTEVLRHPNVVALERSECRADVFYFTLEYCNAGSVADLQKQRGGKLSIVEASSLILETLNGLEYAHNVEISLVNPDNSCTIQSRGLVHRDLKPANIYLCERAGGLTAKVGDFGLSKAFDLAGLSGQTATGSAAGTPVFVPRQQILDYKYAKPEVDVWAAAATYYYMLTGTTPRSFPKGQDPWLVALKSKPEPIRSRDPRIPAALAEIIDEALVDQPEIRFKSAAALKQAIEEVL